MRTAHRFFLCRLVPFALLAVGSLAAATEGCGNNTASTPWSGDDGGGATNHGSSGATSSGSGTTSGGGSGSGGAAPGSDVSVPPGTSSGSSGGSSGGSTSSGGSGGSNSGGGTADASGGSGDAGSGGPSDAGASLGSAGCGATTLPTPSGSVDAGAGRSLPLQLFTITVGGVPREFIVGLPTNYAANTKYPVVFAWHGLGGSDTQVAVGGVSSFDIFGGYYGLRYQSNQSNKPMIFVAGEGLDMNDAGAGWANTGGQDVAFTQQMVTWLESNYCVDEKHIYSVGMSYGGIMSNTVGCAMGDVFRAITPMSGLGPGGFGPPPACKGQVAVWLAHGTQDMTVPFDAGQASRDFWAKANHCSSTTAPTTPSECVAYQGCDPGYPVDWCTFDGGHTVVSFEPQGIWSFLQQF